MDRSFKSYKIEGIVIKRLNYREADKLVTVLTKNQGKIILIAKGIRKINSRRAPHLELFNDISAYATKGRNFDILTEVQTIQVYREIRTDLNKVAFAYRIAEVIDRLCPEREDHYQVYLLCQKTLLQLNLLQGDNLKSLVDDFILELLIELGYLPRKNLVKGEELERFLSEVMEKNLKSDSLLRKL